MCLDGFLSGESGDYASVLSDGRELRSREIAVLIFSVVSGLLRLCRCESSHIIGFLVLVCNAGLLLATPLLVGIFPGSLVALRELAIVLGFDCQGLRTVLSLVSLFVAMLATSTEN